MKKRIVSVLLVLFLLVSATACDKQPATETQQPEINATQVNHEVSALAELTAQLTRIAG